MDKMIYAVIDGRERPMHYSVECMFSVNERFGSLQKALELMEKDNKDSFDVLRYMAVMLVNDAELCRRAEGYDREDPISERNISPRMSPAEYAHLKDAVCEAIAEAYRQEQTDENEETDLGLEELRKKAEAGSRNQNTFTLQ